MIQCSQDTFTITGVVLGTDGSPVSGMTICYTVDGVMHSVTTNSYGEYVLSVPRGSMVSAFAAPGLGVSVSPSRYFFPAVCGNIAERNFRLSPVVPPSLDVTISGTLVGLTPAIGRMVPYTINGVAGNALADVSGNYSFTAPSGSAVVISPPTVSGYTVSPASIQLTSIMADSPSNNFTFTPI